jgi:aminopeptidase YwaD
VAEVAAAEPVLRSRLEKAVDELASAAFAGRRVTTSGHDRARGWLTSELERAGFAVELQPFDSEARVLDVTEISAKLEQARLAPRVDYAEHSRTPSFRLTTAPVVSGESREVAGRWVAFSEPSPPLEEMADELFRAGAAGVLVPRGSFGRYLAKQIGAGSPLPLPILFVRADLVGLLPGRSFSASATIRRPKLSGANIVARIGDNDRSPGTEPLLIGAHYDGVGDDPSVRLPGAADNASGVAVVLEVARRLAQHAWRRPLVVSLFDAEEVNARGSEALAEQLAAANLRPLVLNLDMAARFSGSVAVDGAGADRRLLEALDQAGRSERIPLSVAPVASDNRRFAGAGFASVGIALGGEHYHTPADTPATVDADALARATRLIQATAIQLLR